MMKESEYPQPDVPNLTRHTWRSQIGLGSRRIPIYLAETGWMHLSTATPEIKSASRNIAGLLHNAYNGYVHLKDYINLEAIRQYRYTTKSGEPTHKYELGFVYTLDIEPPTFEAYMGIRGRLLLDIEALFQPGVLKSDLIYRFRRSGNPSSSSVTQFAEEIRSSKGIWPFVPLAEIERGETSLALEDATVSPFYFLREGNNEPDYTREDPTRFVVRLQLRNIISELYNARFALAQDIQNSQTDHQKLVELRSSIDDPRLKDELRKQMDGINRHIAHLYAKKAQYEKEAKERYQRIQGLPSGLSI